MRCCLRRRLNNLPTMRTMMANQTTPKMKMQLTSFPKKKGKKKLLPRRAPTMKKKRKKKRKTSTRGSSDQARAKNPLASSPIPQMLP